MSCGCWSARWLAPRLAVRQHVRPPVWFCGCSALRHVVRGVLPAPWSAALCGTALLFLARRLSRHACSSEPAGSLWQCVACCRHLGRAPCVAALLLCAEPNKVRPPRKVAGPVVARSGLRRAEAVLGRHAKRTAKAPALYATCTAKATQLAGYCKHASTGAEPEQQGRAT